MVSPTYFKGQENLTITTCLSLLQENYHYKKTTVREKILEGENFGELMALKSLAKKILANLLVVY